ncbi:MAG: ribosome biogenesis GTP-binding protein YihA/YsxC [Candidatus Izemoplasmatales bacterium]|jgi:GTP-binding protein
MIIKTVEFYGSAVERHQYPIDNLPEVVLCGRSNVGKSSFINAMLNMKKIARVSSTPGKTRLVNFFLINKQFYFVDLPGYGYAHVSFDNQDDFKTRVEKYLDFRPQLKVAVLLLDVRRNPNADDLMMYAYFKAKIVPVVFILTKADKISSNDRFKQIACIRQMFPAEKADQFILFSATTKENIKPIWEALEKQITQTV